MPISGEDITAITRILKQLELFQGLNEADHAEIIKRITLEYYPKNHVLFHEGDAGDCFYIIKRGMVRIFREAPDAPVDGDTATLGNGDFFGEMALIGDKPRNNSAQTLEESEVFKLTKDDFIKLVSSDPNMASRISSEFLKRMKINMRREEGNA
jgi:CRP/FNR family transcriptional regulator, cyclic AMP receptor protein